jgi:centromere protein I
VCAPLWTSWKEVSPPCNNSDLLLTADLASRIPAKQRVAKVSGVVDAVCRYAFEDGLDTECLRCVVRLVSRKTELDQTSVTNLIKNLFPAQRVPSDILVTLVGALGQGQGKPSPGTQHGLVQWLVTVHGIFEDPNLLSRLYNVLFGMLDMISIRCVSARQCAISTNHFRTPLCHLLSLLTRRKHVKAFRIQRLYARLCVGSYYVH